MVDLAAAHSAGESMTVIIGGRLVQYEPGLPASGMTMFGENGFLMGPEAFFIEVGAKPNGAPRAIQIELQQFCGRRISRSRSTRNKSGGRLRRQSRKVPSMRQPDVTKAWIEAGKLLAVDPTMSVPCPVCGVANLVVQDVVIEGSNKFERIMRCPNCGSQNILLMTRKN